MTSVEMAAGGPASSLVEVNCPVCGSGLSKVLFAAKDWSFRVSHDQFAVRRCLECGVGYVSPRPRERDISAYYPNRYYWSYEGAGEDLAWEKILERRGPQLEAKANVLSTIEPGRLLDIGAQKGDFLWFMQRRGWTVEGAELDNSVPNPKGMPIRYGDFLTMDYPEETFDVVTMWAVLEHLYEPRPFMRKAASLLKPGGRFVALVTNLNSIQARFFRADDYPRHLTLFTKRSIERLANGCGLSPTRVWTDQRVFRGALNGGLVYLAKRLCGYGEDEAFQEWKSMTDPLGFYAQWRGRPSGFILNLSRLDRMLSLVPELVLDRLGYGFNMGFILQKPLLRQTFRDETP